MFDDIEREIVKAAKAPDREHQQERTGRAAHLLGMAVSLILLQKGWILHTQPVVLHFRRGGETLDAFGLVNDLVAGKLSSEDWVRKCSQLGIGEETLGLSM